MIAEWFEHNSSWLMPILLFFICGQLVKMTVVIHEGFTKLAEKLDALPGEVWIARREDEDLQDRIASV